MTKWDAILVNAVGAFLAEAFATSAERARDLEVIGLALPQVSLGDPRIDRLAAQARALVAAGSNGAGALRHGAESALADVLRWRCAQLLDQLTGEPS